jgi:dihydrofolate synthase/folylpolyglutamate synthase
MPQSSKLAKKQSWGLRTWLRYLERLHPKRIELELTRIREVAASLGLLPFPYPAVIVSGTNGKGSTVILLEAILRAAGYRVGSYLSPHLYRYNERIRIDGNELSDADLCAIFYAIETARDKTSLTYFEFGTLAALWQFARTPLDIVILEVGLGGRLDAVNIIDAEIAVITSIGLDHCEWLGDTREKIAVEKAGILRQGKPAVCGDHEPPERLIAIARTLSAPLFCQGRDFGYTQHADGQWSFWNESTRTQALPMPGLAIENAATVLQTLSLLSQRFPVDNEALRVGLQNASLPARIQTLRWEGLTLIIDVAHNPQAASLLAKYLQRTACSGKTLAVFAMLKDKDIAATALAIKNCIDRWYVAGITNARGATGEETAQALGCVGIHASKILRSIEMALIHAIFNAGLFDRVVVFGSFHTAEVVLKSIENCRQAQDALV